MWGGRFALGPSEALDALNRSLPVDHRLWPQDVFASKAWVHALCKAGVIAATEETQLLDGLDRVADKLADGAAVGAPDEDVHTLVERLLYAEIGPVAGKLHTGRSRNDQVATDLRLWTLGAIDELDAAVAALGRTLVTKAKDGLDAILPGYTHGQRAQPVRWAYVLLAHAWPLVRDRQRLADARRRTAELPLGSGALAGSGFPVDRVLLKEALGFRAVSANALDATGDRDFVADVLFAIALIGTHLSRLGAELITYASGEYAFITLSDAFSTGSSLMPQKRNPDVFELARGKSGRMLGDLVALLATLKGIPAGYQKDLQEDKALLFDACDTLGAVLPAVTGAIDTLTVNAGRMAAALDPAMRATDLADLLVEAGVPFRESHGLIGKLVRAAEQAGVSLDKVPANVATVIHPALGPALAQLGSWEQSVESRATPGGASRASVASQIEELRTRVSARSEPVNPSLAASCWSVLAYRMRCLALNASFEPLTMVPVRRALRLVIDGKAEVVEAEGTPVHSERMAVPRPAVIRLVRFVHVPRRFRRQVTNTFLFARDNYRCQFCGRTQADLRQRECLTRDHLVPLSRGGTNAWTNVLTACSSCNTRKGNLLPEEVGMHPLRAPHEPHFVHLSWAVRRLTRTQAKYIRLFYGADVLATLEAL